MSDEEKKFRLTFQLTVRRESEPPKPKDPSAVSMPIYSHSFMNARPERFGLAFKHFMEQMATDEGARRVAEILVDVAEAEDNDALLLLDITRRAKEEKKP